MDLIICIVVRKAGYNFVTSEWRSIDQHRLRRAEHALACRASGQSQGSRNCLSNTIIRNSADAMHYVIVLLVCMLTFMQLDTVSCHRDHQDIGWRARVPRLTVNGLFPCSGSDTECDTNPLFRISDDGIMPR